MNLRGIRERVGIRPWRLAALLVPSAVNFCHSQLSSSLGELAINALVKGLTLVVFIVTFIRSINK